MSVACLGYLVLEVSDIEAWLVFGQQVLGLEHIQKRGEHFFRLDEQGWRIKLQPGATDDLVVLGFEVCNNDELMEMRLHLEQLGLEVRQATALECEDRSVLGLLSIRDPEGLAVEIYYGPESEQELSFRSPQGHSFVTGEQGLGHVLLTGDKQALVKEFFVKALGFRLSDIIHVLDAQGDKRFSIDFLHCNPRHHTLALSERYQKNQKRLGHFMLELSSLDEVGMAYDRALQFGVPISRTLGRHSNDQMISFYMQTPSGFDVELGWGGVTLELSCNRVRQYNAISAWGHKKV